ETSKSSKGCVVLTRVDGSLPTDSASLSHDSVVAEDSLTHRRKRAAVHVIASTVCVQAPRLHRAPSNEERSAIRRTFSIVETRSCVDSYSRFPVHHLVCRALKTRKAGFFYGAPFNRSLDGGAPVDPSKHICASSDGRTRQSAYSTGCS